MVSTNRLALMSGCLRLTSRAFASSVLCAAAQGQVPPAIPPPTAPAAIVPAATAPVMGGATAAVREVYLSRMPDVTSALSSSTRSASQDLHVLVGHSTFIKTITRLKRVYVSNPAVVDSFTSTPTQILITGKEPGVSSLVLWDEEGESATFVVFSDLDVSGLAREVRAALPDDSVKVNAQEDRVSLSGTVGSTASFDVAAKLAALYGKTVINSLVVKPPHVRQVRLKVQIIEIDRSKGAQFGINLFSEGKSQSNITTGQFPSTQTYTPATANTPATITASNPLNLFFYNFGINIGLSLQDLENKQVAQILAEPTISTISGQKASFLSGGEFPFPVVQGSSGGLTSITIQFRPYGVKLDFTPVVNEDGTIQLKVAPEVSALDYTNAVTISGYTIPAISTRRAETQVELRDGQSFAIGGLLDHRTTDIFSKMPGIGDVPILGQLFRSKNVTRSIVELMVLVTPTIVDPLNNPTAPAPPAFPVPIPEPSQFDKTTGKQKPAKQAQQGKGGSE
jgi:pilus assembly protein CpaC